MLARASLVLVGIVLAAFATIGPVRAVDISCDQQWSIEVHRNVASTAADLVRSNGDSRRIFSPIAESDFATFSGKCAVLSIHGEVVPGDAAKVEAAFRLNRFATQAYLISKGGDVTEAIQIGKVFRARNVAVTVPGYRICTPEMAKRYPQLCERRPSSERLFAGQCIALKVSQSDCICASACVVALAGAPARTVLGTLYALAEVAPGIPGDQMVAYSNIGIHRPTAEWFRRADLKDIGAAMSKARADITEALTQFEVPTSLVDLMYEVASNRIVLLTKDAVEKFLPDRAPSRDERTLQVCGSPLSEADLEELSRLERSGRGTPRQRELSGRRYCPGLLQLADSLALR